MKALFYDYKKLKLVFPYRTHRMKKFNKKPFFIIGSGRSGNTLLRRILNSHSDIFIPPETYILGEIINDYITLNGLKWEKLVGVVYSKFEYHPQFNTFNMGSLYPLVQEMTNLPEKDRALDILIDNFYKYYAKKHHIQKPFWGDKTPLNTFHLNKIDLVFPDAKYIHLIRNPYDCIYSYVNSGIYLDYNIAAQRWIHSIKKARTFGKKRKNNYLEIRYENLVREPQRITSLICEFLNVKYESRMLQITENPLGDVERLSHHANVQTPISDKNIGKGKKNLSDREIQDIDKILLTNKKFIQDLIKEKIQE